MATFMVRLISKICEGRCFSTGAVQYGKRNFRKFLVYNKRGSEDYRRDQRLKRKVGLFYDLGVRPIGTHDSLGVFHRVPEMIPQLIVPDLTGFQLKPYVSYRVPDVIQSEFTAQDLFDACYAPKIIKDFQSNKLEEDGKPIEPSDDELRTPEESLIRAKQTGSDIPYQKLELNRK